MFRFHPERSSSPAKPEGSVASTSRHQLSMDITNTSTSTTGSTALAGLSQVDVDLIEDILERAPSSATTFLAVFKAYNEILKERGMDAGDDVLYYRMLLKLGVVKGKDWGERWKAVKSLHGYRASGVSGRRNQLSQPSRPAGKIAAQPPTRQARRPPLPRSIDSFTIHSHQEQISDAQTTDDTEDETEADTDTEKLESQTERSESSYRSNPKLPSNALGLHLEPARLPPLPRISEFLPPKSRIQDKSDDLIPTGTLALAQSQSSTVLPPYQSTASRTPPSRFSSSRPPPTRSTPSPAARQRGNGINEEDAWKKVRMLQDEKEADAFRDERLSQRFWHLWREEANWVVTTVAQVDLARQNFVLRVHFQKWRSRYLRLHEKSESLVHLADKKYLLSVWTRWRAAVNKKKLIDWRDGMRRKMTVVKEKRDARILRSAWELWRDAFHLRVADNHYENRLVHKTVFKWRNKLDAKDALEDRALQFRLHKDRVSMCGAWQTWKTVTTYSQQERDVRSLVDAHRIRATWLKWRSSMQERHNAEALHDRLVLKRSLRSWKAALKHLRALESKADRQRIRQDAILVRAVIHVWVARERGILLERVRMARLLADAWAAWRNRMTQLKKLEFRATKFQKHHSTAALRVAFQRWRRVLQTHQNANRLAVSFYDTRLVARTVHRWRVDLRAKLKLERQAVIARRYLAVRRAYVVWRSKVEQKKREKKLRVFEKRLLTKVFNDWRKRTSQKQYHRAALDILNKRLLHASLRKWTARVISLKLRELEIGERHDAKLQAACFAKWKAARARHVEDLSLMHSYLDVKKEETVRRAFQKWFTKARQVQHRRVLLAEREEENRVRILTKAWDIWREKLLAERLQPLEYNLILQSQRSLLFRAFGVWRSKTRSLPAIRFYSSHTKVKFWKSWRDAMPRALQASRAREYDRQSLIGKALDKWVKIYRTKIAMKAVARARYLRLPSVATKQDSTKALPAPSKMPPLSYMPSTRPRSRSTLSAERSQAGNAGSTAGPSRQREKRLPPAPRPWSLSRPAPATAPSNGASSSEEDAQPPKFGRAQTPRTADIWSNLKHTSKYSRGGHS